MLISINKRFYDPSYIEYYSADTVSEAISIITRFNDHTYHFTISATTTDEVIKVVALSYELDKLDIPHQLNAALKIKED